MHDGIAVVRDDLLPGGTKRRVLGPIMAAAPEEEFVFGGPALGYAQLALAYAARDVGKRATYFVAARRDLHPYTIEAHAAGARIVEVPAGRLSVVQARARKYAEMDPRSRFFPLGFDIPEFHAGLVEIAKQIPISPEFVWATAGSGALSRALQRAWPAADHQAVQIGFPPDVGDATLWRAPERFDERARRPPPFPSCPWYDAKAWQFARCFSGTGSLFWNVGA